MAQGVQIGRGYIAVSVDESGARAALRGFVSFAGSAFKSAIVAAGALGAAAGKVGLSFLNMQEQANIAFTTLLGSGEKAQSFLVELQQFAAKTPFELPGLIDNARQLLGVGVAADKVIPTLGALGNAAGALGLDQERFNRILLATTQAMGKGKLQGEELMQMVENGIPVWQLLSKATGKSVEELQKLSSDGKLLAADTLPLLYDQMNKDYGGAMVAQSQTLQGQWSSLKDNTQILLGTAFKPLFNETKRLTGALGELVSSDDANRWATSFADGLQHGIDATKIFAKSVQGQLGDDFARTMDRLKDRFTELWPTIERGADSAGTILLAVFERAGPAVLDLAEAASGMLRPALEAIVQVLEAVARNADQLASGIATAAQTAGAVAGPAFQILGALLKIVADVLSTLVYLVSDLSGPLGALTGVVLGGVVAFRTLSAVLGGLPGLWRKINPADVASALAPLEKRIGSVAERAGVMTWQLTGSANAGHKVVTAGRSIGTVMAKVGSALPAVGIAAVGLGLAMEASAAAVDEMAANLLKGGQAAETARKQIAAIRTASEDVKGSFDWMPGASGIIDSLFGGQADAAEQSAQRQTESMSVVEQAQLKVTQAQANYSLAVERHGAASTQAQSAQRVLSAATSDLENKQRGAADAAKTHEQSLWDLANAAMASANADVALRQAELNVTEAQTAYTAAMEEHGAASTQAQQAALNLEQSYIRAASAAAQKAFAENAGKSETVQNTAATAAYNQKLLEMAYAAGTKAPPALLKMLDGIDDATLGAINAATATSGFKTQVLTLPSGRTVLIAVDDQGRPVIDGFKRVWDSIQDKTVRLRMIETKGVDPSGHGYGGHTRAEGGPLYPNATTLVGEEGPELITRTRGGWVHDARRTAEMLGMVAPRGGGGSVTQNNYFPPSLDEEQVVSVAMDRLSWMKV